MNSLDTMAILGELRRVEVKWDWRAVPSRESRKYTSEFEYARLMPSHCCLKQCFPSFRCGQ